jgi:hypothetical protein
LYTIDGYVAGVCNFAEPQGDHGLYATPRSIYSVLDRNNLMALYAPATRGSADLLADARSGSNSRRNAPVSVARSQSPDHDERESAGSRARRRTAAGDVMIPPPSLLGIADPVSSNLERGPQAVSGTTKRTAWHPTRDASAAHEPSRGAKAQQTDLSLDPSADHDRFGRVADEPGASPSASNLEGADSSANPAPASRSPSKSRWKPVKASAAHQSESTANSESPPSAP